MRVRKTMGIISISISEFATAINGSSMLSGSPISSALLVSGETAKLFMNMSSTATITIRASQTHFTNSVAAQEKACLKLKFFIAYTPLSSRIFIITIKPITDKSIIPKLKNRMYFVSAKAV